MDLTTFARLGALDHGLCVLSTRRPEGSIQSSVVNAGVLPHARTAAPCVGLVAAGRTHKLRNLRADPTATIVVRAGWEWVAVEGRADIIGPDDGGDVAALPALLRDVFRSAGGTHDDWATFDRVMADERRAAVLIRPTRIYGNVRDV